MLRATTDERSARLRAAYATHSLSALEDATRESVVAHTVSATRMRNKQIGDAWERFCADYLHVIRGYDTVHLLSELDATQRAQFGLTARDVGIDLIARRDGTWSAIQCKFRSAVNRCVAWRELATFLALCQRTGPWHEHVLLTNCIGARREGIRDPRDVTIGRRTLEGLRAHEWLALAGAPSGHVCGGIQVDDAMHMRRERVRVLSASRSESQ